MNKEQLHSFIEKEEPNIVQIAAYKNDNLVYSDEFNGYKENDACHVMSVTKSVVSILIGIAVDKGLIGSIDDKVLSYFPDYKVKKGEHTIQDVTIRHLMSMRAPYKGKGDPWTKVCISDNWTYASLDFLGGRNGIRDEFRYTTVCLHVLTGILYKVTKMSTVDFANEYLFKPLGIEKSKVFYAKNAEEHKAFTLNKKPVEHIWFSDPMDIATPGYGLCLSAMDMAKIGQLVLNEGTYEGKRIVSESWIKEMTVPRIIEDDGYYRGMKYGLLWWIIEDGVCAAIGNSGNVIYVDTKKNITVGLTAYFKPMVFDRIDFIRENIIPYIEKL